MILVVSIAAWNRFLQTKAEMEKQVSLRQGYHRSPGYPNITMADAEACAAHYKARAALIDTAGVRVVEPVAVYKEPKPVDPFRTTET